MRTLSALLVLSLVSVCTAGPAYIRVFPFASDRSLELTITNSTNDPFTFPTMNFDSFDNDYVRAYRPFVPGTLVTTYRDRAGTVLRNNTIKPAADTKLTLFTARKFIMSVWYPLCPLSAFLQLTPPELVSLPLPRLIHNTERMMVSTVSL